VEIIALCRGSEARRKVFFTKWGPLDGLVAACAVPKMFHGVRQVLLPYEIKRRCNSGVSGA